MEYGSVPLFTCWFRPIVPVDSAHDSSASFFRERAILEQFLKAEAMALWAVRSAQAQAVPRAVLQFLRRHEEEEAQHLKQFECCWE